ncbi:unnamed protein product, partial [Dicrocoelium dendriticum]
RASSSCNLVALQKTYSPWTTHIQCAPSKLSVLPYPPLMENSHASRIQSLGGLQLHECSDPHDNVSSRPNSQPTELWRPHCDHVNMHFLIPHWVQCSKHSPSLTAVSNSKNTKAYSIGVVSIV